MKTEVDSVAREWYNPSKLEQANVCVIYLSPFRSKYGSNVWKWYYRGIDPRSFYPCEYLYIKRMKCMAE